MLTTLISLALGVVGNAPQSVALEAPKAQVTTVYAGKVYTATGKVIEDGMVVITDGKITSVGPAPHGDRAEGDLVVAAITPGMVDLSDRNTSPQTVEETTEVSAGYRVADSLDLFNQSWKRQLHQGVTTVVANPYDNNCIGGLSIALKTGGEPTIEARSVKADVALRGSFGSQPSSKNSPARGRPTTFYARRPTTRMGVEWVWRKSFFDALYAEGNPERHFDGLDELVAALNGDVPVFAQAWATQDIRTAVFLKEEMAREGKPNMRLIIDAGAEAWRELDFLTRTKTSVVLPPYAAEGRTRANAFYPSNCAAQLHEAGVPIALSSHNAFYAGKSLGDQAAFARRGGLPFDAALAAVTISPARMIGIDGSVGSIEVGKDGDLALWNGTPFELTSSVVGVVLDGQLVVDPR
ncbi:MAG: imidazolonepropionase-like amidohydrolase [Planctomycetota bacterium]|jgi:imidazolonepropionase-like amidohydrolase